MNQPVIALCPKTPATRRGYAGDVSAREGHMRNAAWGGEEKARFKFAS